MRVIDEIVALFVRKEKRERLLALAAKPARRADFVDALLHDRRNLDPAALAPIGTAPNHGLGRADDEVYRIGGSVDDTRTALREALAAEVGRERDVLLYVPRTRRAYYENHEGEAFVLIGR